MNRVAKRLRSFGFSAVALCLAATFGFSISSFAPTERATRQSQRGRLQRHPRHRMCPGLSQEPCSLLAVQVRHIESGSPPPAAVLCDDLPAPPEFRFSALLDALESAPFAFPPGRFPLPRPPPSLA